MANTERLAVIKMVREAKRVAQNVRYDKSFPIELRIKIEDLFVELDRLEDDLILEAIEEKVSALEKASNRLADVAAQVKRENEKLDALSAKIEKVAKALTVLVDIAAKSAAFV